MDLSSIGFSSGMKGYDLQDWQEALSDGRKVGKKVYCWKSIGVENWLEKGFSISDVFCLVLLPKGLPSYIDLPNDEYEDD